MASSPNIEDVIGSVFLRQKSEVSMEGIIVVLLVFSPVFFTPCFTLLTYKEFQAQNYSLWNSAFSTLEQNEMQYEDQTFFLSLKFGWIQAYPLLANISIASIIYTKREERQRESEERLSLVICYS